MAKILLIEDDPMLVNCYKRILQQHIVIHTEDPKEIEKHIPEVDCVISDYHVPGVDFRDTKKLCDNIGKPLVLVSGSAPERTHQNQLDKPFSIDDIDKFVCRSILSISNQASVMQSTT